MKNLDCRSGFLFLCSLLAVLLGCELAARLILKGNWTEARADRGLHRDSAVREMGFETSPHFSGRFARSRVSLNSKGLRGPEISYEKKEGEFRILALGDSYTFGFGVSRKETYPAELEKRLNAARSQGGQKFRVVNAGTCGYNARQEIAYYKSRGRLFSPDVVILYHYYNDLPPLDSPGDFGVPGAAGRSSFRFPFSAFFSGHSFLYNFVKVRLGEWAKARGAAFDHERFERSLYREDSRTWKGFVADMRKFKKELDRDGAALILTAYDRSDFSDIEYSAFRRRKAPAGKVNDARFLLVKKLAEELGAGFFDPWRGLDPSEPAFIEPLSAHPSAGANRTMGDRAFDFFNGSGHLKRKPRKGLEHMTFDFTNPSVRGRWRESSPFLSFVSCEKPVDGACFTSSGKDPNFSNGSLRLEANRLAAVELRMRVSGRGVKVGQVYWTLEGLGGYLEERSVWFPVIADGKFRVYTLHLDPLAAMKEGKKLSGLRLDPMDARGEGAVREMKLIFLNPAPGPDDGSVGTPMNRIRPRGARRN